MPQIRCYLFMAIFASLCTISKGQDFYIGLKGGYNNANVSSQEFTESLDSIETQRLHAWNIGLVYSYQFYKLPLPVGFSIEAGYNLKGTKTNRDSLNYRFNYLTMPVLLDAYLLNEKLKISVGPEFSYLAKAKNIKNDTTKVSLLSTYNKRWEVSGSVALSYSISFYADLGLKYNTSFTNIANSDAVLERKNLRNQYFQIFLLFKIAN